MPTGFAMSREDVPAIEHPDLGEQLKEADQSQTVELQVVEKIVLGQPKVHMT